MKGINRDSRPPKLNDEILHWAKNVVLTENFASITNEKGSILHSNLNGQTIIGVIPVNDKAIIFSVPSQIGVLSELGYTPVEDTNNISVDLNFLMSRPIVGQYQFNNKEECIIAFTDNFNKPKVANIGLLDTPSYIRTDDIKDVLMFPEGNVAIFTTTILDNGGSLISGVYNVSYAYRNQDVTTNFFQLSAPISITDDSSASTFYDGVLLNIPTAKAIQVNLTGIDTSYEKLILAVVYRTGTGILANELFEYTITGSTLTAVITQLTDNILLPEEVTTPAISYRTVKTLGKLNDRLYSANLSIENDVNYQTQANNIKLNWNVVKTLNVTRQAEKAEQSNASNIGYIAGEVYAFYIRLWFNDGSYSRAFHITGREVETGDKAIAYINATYGLNVPAYKVIDTVNKNGLSNMGFWENENELYPPNFPTLGGQKVRHHRFPTLKWLHSNVYNGSTNFGVTFLPVLGVTASNVIDLPENCTHWELLYARRTYNNSLHYAQSLGIHSAYPANEGQNADTDKIWTSGGNWSTISNSVTEDDDRFIVNDLTNNTLYNTFPYMRLNSPDSQQGKPVLPKASVFIRPEYKLTNRNVTYQNSSIGTSKTLALSDMTSNTTSSTAIPLSTLPELMIDYEYLNNNSIGVNTNYYNVNAEYTLMIESDEDLNFGDNTIGNGRLYTVDGNPLGNDVLTEKAYIVTLQAIRSDCYNSFYLQDTIQTGTLIDALIPQGLFLSGDNYIVDYSYISYCKAFPEDAGGSFAFSGVRAIHRYVLNTPFNYNLRYITNQPYSAYYPKEAFPAMLDDNADYPLDIEPNQIAYNREWSFVEVNKPSVIFNPDDDIINKYPLRIIRSEIFNPELTTNNWKRYLVNDYYEHKERGRGEIINIDGYRNNLIIHQLQGLFITTERTQLDTSQTAVTLGTGDIFDIIPQELIPSSTGYAGTQHQLSCNLSKIGYAFVDSLQGKVFLYNDKLNEISNTGLRNFFQENLVQRETIIEQTTRSIPKTYNSTTNITSIPKFQIEYTTEGVTYYDIIPPVGYTASDNFYFTIGNNSGNEVLNVLKRYNKNVFQDNPFLGNGYSITWDEEYSRLLLNKTKDCNELINTREVELTRTRYLNTATRTILPIVAEGATASGDEGIEEFSYVLNPNENVIFIDFNAIGVPDKVEIIWNGNVVAYSSMENKTPTAHGSYYPHYDRNSGVNPNNTLRFPYRSVPAYPANHAPMSIIGLTNDDLVFNSANTVFYNHLNSGGIWSEWFIGINRIGLPAQNPPSYTAIPTRINEFQEDTGIIYPLSAGKQQRIWFKYSNEDVIINNTVKIRVTGVGSSTLWDFTKFSGITGGIEYYNGSLWQSSYVQWITSNLLTLINVATADFLSSTSFIEWFNGINYQNTETTYTQWFNGVNYQNFFISYLNCGAAFILEGQIKGYSPVVNSSNGDIVIVNTGTELTPVYEYKQKSGASLVNPTTRDEFLLSYSPNTNMWVANHSPKVTYLFSTYNKYYSLSDDEIYLMNANERTTYYYNGTVIKHSAFIDVIFNTQEKTLFSSIVWNTEVFDENGTHYYNETINKIRVYSNTQTTDTIDLVPLKNTRRVYNEWSFNQIRDDNRYNKKFNKNILDNLELIESEIRNKLSHNRGRFIADYVIARLEITTNKEVIIHTIKPVVKQIFR